MKLSLLTDEDVNYNIIRELRKQGFEIASVLEDYRGALDEEVLKISEDTKSLLITEDKDFGEWIFAHKAKASGVIFLRYDPGNLIEITESLPPKTSPYTRRINSPFCSR